MEETGHYIAVALAEGADLATPSSPSANHAWGMPVASSISGRWKVPTRAQRWHPRAMKEQSLSQTLHGAVVSQFFNPPQARIAK